MDDRKRFVTLIKNDESVCKAWRCNKYVEGKICGYADIICYGDNVEQHLPNAKTKIGILIPLKCTQEQYDRFIKVVEKCYPGLCEFNYKC